MRRPPPGPGNAIRLSILRWLLWVFGGSSLLATFAIALPEVWMAEIHRWLGLGELPRVPIVGYLARSLSLFYALFGGLLLLLASDLERFRPVIVYAGWGSVVAGVVLLAVDLHVGLPVWWTWHEGPTATLFGAALLWLGRSIPDERYPR